MTQAIRSLKSSLNREQAAKWFAPRGPIGFLRSAISGPLLAVADFYIPFRVFEVTIENNQSRQTRFAAVDRVTGLLDLYTFDSSPADLVEVNTRNRPEIQLSDDECSRLVVDKFRRIVFNQGFFRLRHFGLHARALPLDLYIPYWVAFRGSTMLNVSVIDAVRRRVEGAKVRQLLKSWLLAQPYGCVPFESSHPLVAG